MNNSKSFRRWYFSDGALEATEVPSQLVRSLDELPNVLNEEADQNLVVVLGSEVLSDVSSNLPTWIGTETKYLVFLDIPEPAILRVPVLLGIYKPDRRMHATRDPDSVKRALIALHRSESWEGIVDAYLLGDHLVAVLGDFSIRDVPRRRLPGVGRLDAASFGRFEIDGSGSFLHWPEPDVHLGPSQILQAVDPTHRADVEIQRYALEKISVALLSMRRVRSLRQSDIRGLSERHVRRLEKEETRLTVDVAAKYAETFGQTVPEFLDELSRRISLLSDEAAGGGGTLVEDEVVFAV